jgi:hypothetical protein
VRCKPAVFLKTGPLSGISSTRTVTGGCTGFSYGQVKIGERIGARMGFNLPGMNICIKRGSPPIYSEFLKKIPVLKMPSIPKFTRYRKNSEGSSVLPVI